MESESLCCLQLTKVFSKNSSNQVLTLTTDVNTVVNKEIKLTFIKLTRTLSLPWVPFL